MYKNCPYVVPQVHHDAIITHSMLMMTLSENTLKLMLIEGNKQHDGHPHGHPQHLQYHLQPVTLLLLVTRDGVSMSRRQFWHHVHKSNIQEDARCGCKYPWGEVVDGAKCHTSFQQQGIVPWK